MAVDLEKYLQCPDCRGSVRKESNWFACSTCRRSFVPEDGIQMFMPTRREPCPKFYDDPEYDRYIQKLDRLHEVHYKPGSLTGRIEESVKTRMARLVKDYQPPLVDLGCGTGRGFEALGPDEDIIGVDNNPALLRECHRLHPKATLICCDMLHPPFRPKAFQFISCIGTLEHIFYLEAFVASVERVLADDGYFYVEVPTEGGLLWRLGRALVTSPRNSKLLGVNYRRVIAKDHCNTIFTVHNVLTKFFRFDEVYEYPLGFGGKNINVAMMYRLRKLKPNRSHDSRPAGL